MEERIDLESAQIDQWLGRLFNYTYLWIFFTIFGIIFLFPIALAIIYHNWWLLFLFPISLACAMVFLVIVLKIEDKYYDTKEYFK
jgi:hypothetical protein